MKKIRGLSDSQQKQLERLMERGCMGITCESCILGTRDDRSRVHCAGEATTWRIKEKAGELLDMCLAAQEMEDALSQ